MLSKAKCGHEVTLIAHCTSATLCTIHHRLKPLTTHLISASTAQQQAMTERREFSKEKRRKNKKIENKDDDQLRTDESQEGKRRDAREQE